MKKFVSIAITIMLVFSVGIANGQGYTFRVLANKGQNKVKKEGASAAVALKTGATLAGGDELIASNGAYIGLMHKSGKTLEVRTSGTKKVSDLEKLVSTKTASVSSRYAQFLAEKMNEKEKPGYRSRLNATGAAKRGSEGNIEMLVPADATVVGDNAIISWERPSDIEDNTYIVIVKNIFDEEIMKEEVAGNSINLDFTTEQMQNEEGLYIINVQTKENKDISSADIGLKRLTGEDAISYQEGANELSADLDQDSPLGKIILASFYEENGLVVDALTQLEEAIKMSPEVDDFKELRKDLIERSSIKVYEEAGDE